MRPSGDLLPGAVGVILQVIPIDGFVRGLQVQGLFHVAQHVLQLRTHQLHRQMNQCRKFSRILEFPEHPRRHPACDPPLMGHIAAVHDGIVDSNVAPGEQLRQQQRALRRAVSPVQPAAAVGLHILLDLSGLIGKGGEGTAALIEAVHGGEDQPVVLRQRLQQLILAPPVLPHAVIDQYRRCIHAPEFMKFHRCPPLNIRSVSLCKKVRLTQPNPSSSDDIAASCR